MKQDHSTSWKNSKQPRKQRKYRYNATLATKHKFVSGNLSKELRKTYENRSLPIRKGDKVQITRGSLKGKLGKVERVSIQYEKIFVTGIEIIKKDGSKVLVPLSPSNLVILELNLDDKKRQNKLKKKNKEK